MKYFADFLDVTVCNLASVMDNVGINGIANLGVCTGRIKFQYTFMCSAMAVRKLSTVVFCRSYWWLFVIIPLILIFCLASLLVCKFLVEKFCSKLINLLNGNTLTNSCKKRRIEKRLVGEF